MARATILFVLTILCGAVLSPLVEPFVQGWLASHGYYDGGPLWLSAVMNWVVTLVGDAAFPWVSGGVVGATLGAWAVTVASRIDHNKPSQDQRFGMLYGEIHGVADAFMDQIAQCSRNEGQKQKVAYNLDLRLRSLYERLRAVKLQPPLFAYDRPEEYNIGHHAYLSALLPFAKNDQLALGKKESARVVQDVRQGFASLSLQQLQGTSPEMQPYVSNAPSGNI